MKTTIQVNAPRYSKERWAAAQASWKAGEPWSEEWRFWRHLAAENGILEAPEGSGWDQWDDESPSQRAMLIRAIRETPKTLRAAIVSPRTHSWATVIEAVLQRRDTMVAEAAEERGSAHDPSPQESGALLRRIRDVTGPDGPRILAAVREGKCPTCGQPLPERNPA
jgi:hypothetical protein